MSNQLIEAQRYEIYLGLKRKWSKTRIAKEIGVSKSTVSREIQRNSKPNGEYVWRYAQKQCDLRKHGFKGNHRKPEELWWRIEQMIIEEDWSPAQISGVLKKEGIHICKQTIYNHVHADTTGKLSSHMHHELKYTKRHKVLRPTKATNIANRTSIHSRPIEADGKRFGDWKSAVAKYQIPWVNVYNDTQNVKEGRPDQTYAIQGYPTKIIINPEGKIAKIVTGEDPQFYTDLDNLLQ